MSRIELVTQPSKEKLDELEIREKTLDKLHNLVDETLEESTEHKDAQNDEFKETEKLILEQKRSPSPELDHDGFEVPKGKIPIDGNFSASEVKQLVELAKEEGLLAEQVEVKVLERNSIGNKVVVKETISKESVSEKTKTEQDNDRKTADA